MSAGVKSAFAARPGVILDQAAAELFERTFREGMDLIAEVSAYLDGIGRLDSRRMTRDRRLRRGERAAHHPPHADRVLADGAEVSP